LVPIRSDALMLCATPAGARYSRKSESDIVSLTYASGVLRLVIDTVTLEGQLVSLEVEFDAPRGFRLLDEGDLIRYWETDVFAGGYHVFEITSGGWRSQETQFSRMLTVSDAIGAREWFVATSNTCVNVLCGEPPRISEGAAG
jgi:hypothetical protein